MYAPCRYSHAWAVLSTLVRARSIPRSRTVRAARFRARACNIFMLTPSIPPYPDPNRMAEINGLILNQNA